MTVADLKDKLDDYDDDRRIVVKGYESGYDDVEEVELVEIVLNQNLKWYYGTHEKAYDREKHEDALVIK